MFEWPILVALLPALFCTVLAIFIAVPAWLAKRLQSREFVELLKDVFMNMTGAGTTLGALIGIKDGSPESVVIAALFALCMLFLIHSLTRHLESMRKLEEQRAAEEEAKRLERLRETWRD